MRWIIVWLVSPSVATMGVLGRPVPRPSSHALVAVPAALVRAVAGTTRVGARTVFAASGVVFGPPVVDPLFGVSDHVVESVSARWTGTDFEDPPRVWVRTSLRDATRAAGLILDDRALAVSRFGAPRIQVALWPTTGEFELRIGRKPSLARGAKLPSLKPVHPRDRLGRRVVVSIERSSALALAAVDARLVTFVRDLGPVDVERVDPHFSGRDYRRTTVSWLVRLVALMRVLIESAREPATRYALHALWWVGTERHGESVRRWPRRRFFRQKFIRTISRPRINCRPVVARAFRFFAVGARLIGNPSRTRRFSLINQRP
jgi:hypothetical protein